MVYLRLIDSNFLWLDDTLTNRPLLPNKHTMSDIFSFSEDLSNMSLKENHVPVSYYDVFLSFTSVPHNETIDIITSGFLLTIGLMNNIN